LDVHDSPETYKALMSTLEDICKFVSAILEKHLPDIHSQLSVFCDILPLNIRPTTHPFPGLVINLQACTEAHLDGSDDIPFGELDDGELVLFEAGLMVHLQEGDMFVFPSFHLTHFNMSFRGVKRSIVMHSDKNASRWKLDLDSN